MAISSRPSGVGRGDHRGGRPAARCDERLFRRGPKGPAATRGPSARRRSGGRRAPCVSRCTHSALNGHTNPFPPCSRRSLSQPHHRNRRTGWVALGFTAVPSGPSRRTAPLRGEAGAWASAVRAPALIDDVAVPRGDPVASSEVGGRLVSRDRFAGPFGREIADWPATDRPRVQHRLLRRETASEEKGWLPVLSSPPAGPRRCWAGSGTGWR